MAFTVCIAEDEYYVQKSIEARINALQKEIEVLGFAFDGIEAEQLYYKFRPDIYFVDISMPQCSGLEFIEKIRKDDPDCRTVFIIVSSYSDYNNMRRAINVNVFDYLKKPIVPSEFADIVDRAVLLVQKRREEMQHTGHGEIFYDEYLQESSKEISGTMILFLIDSARCTAESVDGQEQMLKQLGQLGKAGYIIFRNTDLVKLLFFENQMLNVRQVEKLVLQNKCPGIAVFFREIRNGRPEQELKLLAGEVSRRFFETRLFYEVKEGRKKPDKMDFSYLFLKSTPSEMEAGIREVWRILCEKKGAEYVYPFFNSFLFLLAKKYDDEKLPIPEQVKRDQLLFSMARFRSVEEIEGYLIQSIMQFGESVEQKQPREMIDRICDYIQSHYMDPLTLNDLAEIFYISPSYLSHSFTKKKQQSVVKYIGDVRLEKAAGYLKNTQIPIADIAERTGYSDGNYFSKAFKKKYGESPGDYRKKWQDD